MNNSSCATRIKYAMGESQPDVLHDLQAVPGCRMTENSTNSSWGGAREGAGRPPKRAIEFLPAGPRWYVVQVSAGSERRVVQDLLEGEDRRGYPVRPPFEVYRPMTPILRYRRGKALTDHVSMFSGYGLVRFDRKTDHWQSIVACDGVVRLMMTRTMVPIPLPEGFVEGLKETAALRLKLPEARMEVCAVGASLVVGDGPFQGYPALCRECDGLTTTGTVHIFGRLVDLTLPRSSWRVA